MPRTGGTGSGLWPTSTVDGNYNRKGLSPTSGDGLATVVKMWPTPQARDHMPAHTPEYVEEKRAQGHGMRNLNDEVKMWPTPTAMNDSGGPAMCKWGGAGARKVLRENVPEEMNGSLNPDWVEDLMMWPPGWGDPASSPVREKLSMILKRPASLQEFRTAEAA